MRAILRKLLDALRPPAKSASSTTAVPQMFELGQMEPWSRTLVDSGNLRARNLYLERNGHEAEPMIGRSCEPSSRPGVTRRDDAYSHRQRLQADSLRRMNQ